MAGANNPIGFSDFFNFSDRELILQAITDMKDLRSAYKEFKAEVTGKFAAGADQQMAALSAEIQGVAKASRELNITNQQSQKVLTDNLGVVERLRAENAGLKASKDGARQSEIALMGSVDGLTAKLLEQVRAWRAVDQSTEGGHVLGERLAAGIRQTKTEINELNAATKVTTSIFRAAAGSYNELDIQTKQMVKDLKAMEGGMGANAARAKELQAQIFANTAKLKEFDGQMNHNFRNVGNYKSAFDGLGNSVNQLSRELPAFTNSVQTGFLAISNNLPILTDQIGMLIARNRVLRAEGQPTQSVFRSLAGAVFSWGTALSLGITLLTIYGKDIVGFIGKLFNGSAALDRIRLKQEALNAVMKEADVEAGKQISKLNILYTSATNVNLPMEDRLRAVRALQKEFPDYFGKIDKEIILNGKAEASYKRLYQSIIDTARATAAASEIGKLEGQKLEAEERKQKIKNATARETVAVKKDVTDIVGAASGFGQLPGTQTDRAVLTVAEQRARIEDRKVRALKEQDALITKINDKEKFLVDFVGAKNLLGASGASTADDEKARKKEEAERKKREREQARDERALEQAIRKKDDLLKATAKFEIALAEQRFAATAKTVDDEINLERERLQITTKYIALRAGLYKKDSKEYKELQAERIDAENKAAERITAIRDKDIQARLAAAIKIAQAEYNRTEQGWTDELQFETKKLELLRAAYDERLKLYKSDSDEYKALASERADVEAATQARIRKIQESQGKAKQAATDSGQDLTNAIIGGNIRKDVAKGKLSRDEGDRLLHLERIAQIQDEVNAKQDQLDKAKEGDADYYTYLKELNGLKKELVDEGTNYEIASAERVKEKKQELEQAAFDFATETAGQLFDIGRTLNESNIAALEADKQKELDLAGNNSTARRRIEENFQKDIIKLRRKQAIYDKLQALFDIGVNTAIAITKATAASPLTFGQPWVTYAIIQGAVQAAAVIAKPLPKYWKGRGKGKQEFALVNEQGPEALVKDGSVRFANRGKKGVTWLQAGEEVKTATETRQMLENAVNTEDGLAYMHSLLKGESVMRQAQEKQDNRMIRAMAKQVLTKEALTGAFSDAVAKLPVSVWEVDDKGARRYTRTLSGKTEIMNSRNQLGSNG